MTYLLLVNYAFVINNGDDDDDDGADDGGADGDTG